MSLAVQIAVQANIPVIVWGDPGTGKTAFFEALAHAMEVPLETVIASECEPTDFGGIPFPQEGEMRRAPADWAMRLIAAGKGILFLDEFSCAPPTVQKATLRTVRSRYVGGRKLPDAVCVALAANPPENAADGYDLSPPSANRMCHIEWRFDAISWTEAAVAGFPTPKVVRLGEGWKGKYAFYLAMCASFIRTRPDLGLKLPKDESAKGKAWPSGRTWDMAATLQAASDGAGANEAIRTELIAGCVGEGAALEYIQWLKAQDLPDPETLLANPGAFRLPERGDRSYAILASVVAAVSNRNTIPRWTAACDILGVAAKMGVMDIAATAAKSLMAIQPKGAKVSTSFQSLFAVVSAAGMIKQGRS